MSRAGTTGPCRDAGAPRPGVGVRRHRPEVRRLHRPGTSTGDHGEPSGGEVVAEPGSHGIRRRVACQRMAAHHADDRSVLDELVERVGDRVVVDGSQEGDEGVVLERAVPGPVVGHGIGRALVPVLAQARVQLVRLVEAGPVGVDRRVRVGREDQRTVRAQVGVERLRQLAAEDHHALDVGAAEQLVLVPREVEVLEPQAAQRHARPKGLREVRQTLDLVHAPNLPASPARNSPSCPLGPTARLSVRAAAASVGGQAGQHWAEPGRCAGDELLTVGQPGHPQARVHAEPAQRLGLPPW